MILPARPEDARALSELVNSAYRGESSRLGWTTEADLVDGTRTEPDLIAATLQQQQTIILKCVDQDEIIGCVQLERQGSKLYLGMLTVNPGLQAKGIGKQLLKAAELEAIRQQCTAIYMTVISVRAELIEWYQRHGYRDTGKRKPFVMPDSRFGIPKKTLEFMVLEKKLLG